MSPLQNILATYQSEREKGTYFGELIRTYFRYEANFADRYSDVWHKRTPSFAFKQRRIGTRVKRDHGFELTTSRIRPTPHCIFN